ncbi:MAG: dockerin type I domain-containing protein [Candidatus Binatia bacterium]
MLLLVLLAAPAAVAPAQLSSSTTTTTTTLVPPPSTTLDEGRDVSGGGRFQGGFGAFGYDLWLFNIVSPFVLLVETSDGADQCSGDTIMELSKDDVLLAFDDDSGPARCSRIEYRLTEPGAYEIRVAGFQNVGIPRYFLDVEFVETECGNDLVEPLEECDDGNFDEDDCCLGDCTKAADDTTCDDGLLCNGDDLCADGHCIVHTMNPCPGVDGDENCTESCSDANPGCGAPDPDGSPCDDDLFCNGADRCSGGLCVVHAGDPCRGPDLDGDCTESCKESTETCSAADPGVTPCDDLLFCNGTDQCFGGLCSLHTGNPCTGPDGDGNCRESCSESADNCLGADPVGSSCTDGLFCNGADSCSAGNCTLHTGSPCPGPDGDINCAESCNEAGDNCLAADMNGAPCNDGVFCNGADTCSGGTCSVHAGNPCPGADGDGNCAESCNEAADTCTAADANGSACHDGVFCNGADTCSAGACSAHVGNPCPGADGDSNCAETCNEATDACTAPDPNGAACNDGVFCNGTDTCSAGACSVHVGNPCVGADGDGNCSESCNEAADTCAGPDVNGSACSDGLFCNGADTCSGGACSVHAGDPCPGTDGDGNCSESCNEIADACTLADANGAACADGVFCNGTDTCAGGTCSMHAGDPCPGADGDGNCSESCNEAGDACTAADMNGSSCTDGLFCNGVDTCSGGACSAHGGDPCPGADGDGNCGESCNEAGDACTAADMNGSSCTDGLFCNGADTCSAGACSVHAGDPCPGADGDGNCSETCSEAADACSAADMNGSACNDGDFCNGADTCSGGACSVHAGDPCPGTDGDGDCSESCNEAADSCTGPDPNDTACDDGLFCNGTDTCSAGSCILHSGVGCPGADGDSDCTESCSDAAEGCTGNDPAGSPCDDGVFCNGPDRCSGGSCSVHLGSPCPGADGDGNCSESCNETTDSCTAPDPNGSACSDGLFCNGADTCSAGACSVHPGSPCPGPDGDGNCAETCNETADACTAPDMNGASCNDGLFCNGADTCSGGACSQHAGNPCPGPDGDGNCSETCNETADACTAPDMNGASCNDGLFCNGGDACSAGACSVHTGDPCDGADGDANCSESCSEAADACTAADPNGSACDDALFCNGEDICSSGACAVHSGTPCPGPNGDANCSQSCAEAADSCTAPDPDGSACDDDVFCNGADTCSGGTCAIHPGGRCPGPDGDADCSEGCNETAQACTSLDPEGSACNDGDPCSTDDACDDAGACMGGAPRNCDDTDPCTADACLEEEPYCAYEPVPNCPPSTTTTLPPSNCGDVNGNGSVTAGDALAVLKAAVGGPECSASPCTCDVNSSGGVTASDALAVLRSAVGSLATLNCSC